jgi:hypothetical protein
VDYYRKTRQTDIDTISKVAEMDALNQGLALKEVRVAKLQQLAALMEKDLFGGFMWTDQVKSIGSGYGQQVVEYELFNSAEVDAYRGLLDDIAKEVGGRVVKQETEQRIVVEWAYDDDPAKGNAP